MFIDTFKIFSLTFYVNIFYTGFRRKARVRKCKPLLVAKRGGGGGVMGHGVMVPGVPFVDRENWGRELALRGYSVMRRIFGKNRALYVHLKHKNVDRFRKGSVHELYCLKASKVSKVHA